MHSLLKGIWRASPVGLRRWFAHGLLTHIAPGLPSPAPGANEGPVIVVGFLSSASGLGQAARLAYMALERQGRSMLGIDLSKFFFEAGDSVAFPFRDGRNHRGAGHVLININAPYLKYVFQLLGDGFLRSKYITGYWAWELPRAPENWREGLDRVHAVAVPSRFVADAVESLGGSKPIHILPHPVAVEAWPSRRPRRGPVSLAAPFTIASALNVASGFERKNPLALLAAFRLASGGRLDWRLRMLVANVEHYSAAQEALRQAAIGLNVEITFDAFDRDGYWRWLGAPDLYASLHRSEGFGLPLAEAMSVGIPALATNWSGNTDYMTNENSLLVRYRLHGSVDPQRKYEQPAEVWADPDIEHAAELMIGAREHPDMLEEKARAAVADLATYTRLAL